MSNALIIDDEILARETIRNVIKLYCPGITSITECDSVDAAKAEIVRALPDIVFLDIKMPNKTGFDFLKGFRAPLPFKLIFITAHDEYAVQAFKFSALDYLLKPVDPDELIAAVNKAEDVIAKERMLSKLEALIHNMENTKPETKRVILKTSDSIHVINIKDIIRCEADKNYTSFFLSNTKKIIVSNTLKEYDELLTPLGFFRTHQSHLVNMQHIERYEKKDGGTLIMNDESTIPVAVRKKDELLDLLQRS